MKKIRLVLALVLIFLGSIAHAEGSSIEDYFPMKLNVGYHYDVVQGPSDLLGRWEYRSCIKKEKEGGEMTGTFHAFHYLKSMKTETVEVYSTGNKEIFLNYHEGLYGSHKYVLRPIILKIPQKGSREKWDAPDEQDEGKSKAICTSEYIPTLNTALGTFQNVIKITKTTTVSSGNTYKEVKYYAKGKGLIRTELGSGKEKMIIDLVKVETN